MALYTDAEIIKKVKDYLSSPIRKKLLDLQALYDADNPAIIAAGREKAARNKTPNNVIPTGYYSTVTDTMGGYMFSDVQYTCEDEGYQKNLDDIFKANNIQVEDMQMGTSALAYNKGIEYVYTDGKSDIKIKELNPANTIILRDSTIMRNPEAAINFTVLNTEMSEFDVMYIEPELERRFTVKDDNVVMPEERPLPFTDLPVIEYNTQILGKKAPFEVVIPYIRGLDALVSGNANEIDRLVDALLVLGKDMSPEELKHSEEWKALVDWSTEDRAEYLTKDMSPEFRKYVSELLIREIHKHSHVIDWYSADNGNTSDASGKALRTRLFDMDMYSKRLEMAYRDGAQKRIAAISVLAVPLKMPIGEVEIVYKRTMIDDFVDDSVKLATVPFLPDAYKRKYLGVDEAEVQAMLEAEGVETEFDLEDRADDVVGKTPTGVVLNGAQIQAISDLAQKVALGELSRPEAVNLAMLLGLDRETAESVIPEQGDAKAADL